MTVASRHLIIKKGTDPIRAVILFRVFEDDKEVDAKLYDKKEAIDDSNTHVIHMGQPMWILPGIDDDGVDCLIAEAATE